MDKSLFEEDLKSLREICEKSLKFSKHDIYCVLIEKIMTDKNEPIQTTKEKILKLLEKPRLEQGELPHEITMESLGYELLKEDFFDLHLMAWQDTINAITETFKKLEKYSEEKQYLTTLAEHQVFILFVFMYFGSHPEKSTYWQNGKEYRMFLEEFENKKISIHNSFESLNRYLTNYNVV